MSKHMPFPRVHMKPASIGEVVEHALEDGEAITIIACCLRSHFLAQLVEHTQRQDVIGAEGGGPPTSTSRVAAEGDEDEDEDEQFVVSQVPRTHRLLHPTLDLLAASSRVKLAFCPTIPTFRAYLSALPVRAGGDGARASNRVVIIDVLSLHHGTTEFTLQGLSRSFSLIASVTHACGVEVELFECADSFGEPGSQDGPLSWNAEVPLLSGSIKIADAGRGWASRTTTISEFGNRWFTFE